MKDMKMKKPKMPKMGAEISRPGMAMPQFASRAMRPGGMAKGGKIHEDAAMDKKLIRKEIARAEKMEEKSEKKKMKKGGDIMAIKDNPMGRKMASAAMGAKKMFRGRSPSTNTLPARPLPAGGPGGGKPAMPGMMKKDGAVGKMAKGSGVERKGKTKGRFI